MTDTLLKLNRKINTNTRQRRRSLRSLTYKKKRGILYTEELPKVEDSYAAIAVDTHNGKVYVNGGKLWYNLDSVSLTIDAVDGMHLVPIYGQVVIQSMFYYNETEQIQLAIAGEVIDVPVLVINERPGYKLFVKYVEVKE